MRKRLIALISAGLLTFSYPVTQPTMNFHLHKKSKKVNRLKPTAKSQIISEWIKKAKEKALLEKYRKESEEAFKRDKIRKEESKKEWHNFILTYYSGSAKENGNSLMKTASGTKMVAGRTIAVPRSIPFGTKIYIKGHEYIAEDTGNPKYICVLPNGDIRVDIYVDSINDIPKCGVEKVKGYILKEN